MKIIEEKNERNFKFFEDLIAGEIFKYNNQYYMKIKDVLCNDDYYTTDCINLLTGFTELLEDDIKVELLPNCKLVIKN